MLIACERCRRHFSIREQACPFCRHGSTLARVGAAALSAGLLLGGCDAGSAKSPTAGSAGTGSAAQGSAAPQRTYATIRGVITSRTDGPLPAFVTVSLQDPTGERLLNKTIKADANGHYLVDLLEPGAYQMSIGYNSLNARRSGGESRNVVLHPGEDLDLDVVLEVREMEVAPPYGAPPQRRRVV